MKFGKSIILTEKQKQEAKAKEDYENKEKADAFLFDYREIRRKHGFEFISVVGYEPTKGVFPQLLIQKIVEPQIPEELRKLNEQK